MKLSDLKVSERKLLKICVTKGLDVGYFITTCGRELTLDDALDLYDQAQKKLLIKEASSTTDTLK